MVTRNCVFDPLADVHRVVAYAFEILCYHHKQYSLIGGFGIAFDEFDEFSFDFLEQFVYAVVAFFKASGLRRQCR